MRLKIALSHDISFQFRHGFYYAYLLVSFIYIVILSVLPIDVRENVGAIIIFSDPSALGLFFVGGILLLERDQNILERLFVTPFQIREYLISKVASLTLLALSTSFVIKIVAFGFSYNPFPLLLGVTLCSIFFTLLGIALAVRVKTVNGFLFMSPLYITFFYLPLVDYFSNWVTPLVYINPGNSALLLIGATFHPISNAEMALAVMILLIWIGVAYWWAKYSFYQKIILKVGRITK